MGALVASVTTRSENAERSLWAGFDKVSVLI